jgi:O-antigen ligase
MPVLLLPLLNGYDRAPLIGLLSALTFFTYMVLQNSKHRVLVIAFGVGILCTIYSGFGESLTDKTASFLGGEVRPDYLSADSFFSRVGAWLRCIDVFIRSFPFGVGPGVVFYYMGSSDIPSHFVLSGADFRTIAYYENLRFGMHVTGSHNLFLQYIAEYGLLGVITIISFVCLVLSRFLSFKRRAKKIYPKYYDYFLAQVCCYSIMIGLGVFYCFQNTPEYYFIFLLFLYLIFLIPKLEDEGNTI